MADMMTEKNGSIAFTVCVNDTATCTPDGAAQNRRVSANEAVVVLQQRQRQRRKRTAQC